MTEALFVGLSLPKVSLDDNGYRYMIRLSSKLGFYEATKNLILCLSESVEIKKKSKNLLPEIEEKGNRNSIILAKLTSSHLDKPMEKETIRKSQIVTHKTIPPIILPKLFFQHRSLIKGMVSRELRMKYHNQP